MLVQVEDCMDVWNTLTWTSYLFPLWESDYLPGHESEREDGLTNSSTQLKIFWGKGRNMGESVLTDGRVGTIDHADKVHTRAQAKCVDVVLIGKVDQK
jgi:hypothetical protein